VLAGVLLRISEPLDPLFTRLARSRRNPVRRVQGSAFRDLMAFRDLTTFRIEFIPISYRVFWRIESFQACCRITRFNSTSGERRRATASTANLVSTNSLPI
jgi:hypothetical protein